MYSRFWLFLSLALILATFINCNVIYFVIILVLFNIFDFRCKKRLNFVELTLLFKSIVRGFCFLTDQPLPENSLL